jgi:cytochrome b561
MEQQHWLLFCIKHSRHNLLEKRGPKCWWILVCIKVCKQMFESWQTLHTFFVKVSIYETMVLLPSFGLHTKRTTTESREYFFSSEWEMMSSTLMDTLPIVASIDIL